MGTKYINIFGGGTVSHVRNHLALCAPAYGGTARELAELCRHGTGLGVRLHLTKMAGGNQSGVWPAMETWEDVAVRLDGLVNDPATKIIFMTMAIVDFSGFIPFVKSGPLAARVHSRQEKTLPARLDALPKLLPRIRQTRKDIFLVAFKTTVGATEDEQYLAGLQLLKESSCNLVLANDLKTKLNMIVTPEEARYEVTIDRRAALKALVKMTLQRSQLTFTRSTVVKGDPVPWDSPLVPPSLRKVVDYCIAQGAYKPFNGATVGHFACKLNATTFLTSIRKTNFNDLPKTGLVKIETDGPDHVLAYGAKPSVGGQSQRIVFSYHPNYDCIVHFHCPRRATSEVPIVSQREYECGSHECGRNTARGLKQFGDLSAVYLDEHGPNIVFNKAIDHRLVIKFIDENFDLSQKTGGYVNLGQILQTPDHVEDLQAYTAPGAEEK